MSRYTDAMMTARNWFALLPALLVCSCGTVKFYTQAMGGQMEIWRESRSNATVLADDSVSTHVKRRLELIEELRAYAASDLHLPTKSFGKYCDLKRPYVVWVVYAAPEFSVEGKKWWYPLVGSLKYRGFFDEKDAVVEAKQLKNKGYDVFVGGVEAYSTLGYLKDPVLNTFLHRSDADLAELIFHELTHAKVFIPGDTDFNEAFATANAEEGVRRWLRSKRDFVTLRKYESERRKNREIIHLMLEARDQLKAVYANSHLDVEAERRAKRQVFEEMLKKALVLRPSSNARGPQGAPGWNNARLNTVATYYTMVPGFERILKQHGGDLEAFHHEVESMRKLDNDERMKILGTPKS
ncbi:aminopeptidase [Prosthecobacter sp.]|uniref:aminopeptidase n=1 Tax=Prosthecobacter sp. TaxID=1965333 RepID=UPI001D953351|nr:aminopeptidase [Prosthecobacter sp.]MCB1279138.1 aminopeptidase [Prosthecobacter sp.]